MATKMLTCREWRSEQNSETILTAADFHEGESPRWHRQISGLVSAHACRRGIFGVMPASLDTGYCTMEKRA